MLLFSKHKHTHFTDISFDTIFIVTSTIHPISAPLSYTGTRSVFTAHERLIQTIATIDSVREKVPDAAIAFVENSPLSESEKNLVENAGARLISYCEDKETVKWRDSPFKGAGELYMLMQTLKWLKNCGYRRMFKLSGRYCLDGNFEQSLFPMDKFGFYSDGASFSTRLYSVPKSLESLYGRQMKKAFANALKGYSIESYIMKGVPRDKIDLLPFLGITGQLAVTGDCISE